MLAWIARNLTRGANGRKWMAIRDMDIAAEIIGVNPLMAKLTAFAISSFYVGVAGALLFTVYLGAVEVGEAFGVREIVSDSVYDYYWRLGVDFWIACRGGLYGVACRLSEKCHGGQLGWARDIAAHFEFVIVGRLIIVFLILEPHGSAKLWRIIKEKLRLWPFPH